MRVQTKLYSGSVAVYNHSNTIFIGSNVQILDDISNKVPYQLEVANANASRGIQNKDKIDAILTFCICTTN